MSRYHRQQLVPQLGVGSGDALANAKVLIVGAGGLGCPVASLLAGAGVGLITLVDFDVVDISNLHRQTLFGEPDMGKSKVLAAQSRLRASNSEIQIDAVNERLSPSNVDDLVRSHSVIVDAADSFFVSYLLSDSCLTQRRPLVAASALQTSGYVGVFCGTKELPAPSMRAVFPAPSVVAQNCSTAGVTGPSVATIGSIQAQEVLKVIVADPTQLLGKLMHLDLWSYSQNIVNFIDADEPQKIAELISESSRIETDIMLDVRSADELAESPRSGNILNIPVNELPGRAEELPKDRRIVCVCHSGQRALNAAHQLIKLGFDNVVAAI